MAMLLMVTIGYVFSYLIPTKQKSVIFPIYSNQAFFIAQSGLEYAIRYASNQGWRGTTDSGVYDLTHLNDVGVNQRNLGNGQFTINYNNGTNVLTSTGTMTNASPRRVVKVSNFTGFLRLIFDPDSPAPSWSGTQAQFAIKNVRGSNVTLTAFSATWTQTGSTRTISEIDMNGTQKYVGSYSNGGAPQNFNRGGNTQTITPNQVITILVYWNKNVPNMANLVITFYTASGDSYPFNLDPQGNGL